MHVAFSWEKSDKCPKVTLVTEGYMIGKEWNLTLGDSHFFGTPQGGPLRSCGSAQKKGKNELVRMRDDRSPGLQSTPIVEKECTF